MGFPHADHWYRPISNLDSLRGYARLDDFTPVAPLQLITIILYKGSKSRLNTSVPSICNAVTKLAYAEAGEF